MLNQDIAASPPVAALAFAGKVASVKPFGIFVDLGSVDASVALSRDMASTMANLERHGKAQAGMWVIPISTNGIQWSKTEATCIARSGSQEPGSPQVLSHVAAVAWMWQGSLYWRCLRGCTGASWNKTHP